MWKFRKHLVTLFLLVMFSQENLKSQAKDYANSLLTKFKTDPTIVIAQVNVNMKNSPIGYYFDKDLWEPGRYFDSLVRQGKVGLYVYK